MAYSELIKNFAKIREYMNQFYVYGFKNRSEYNLKSARSYDNERRRIESWLGDYMLFHRTAEGKNVFLAVDSRSVSHNPLYKAFKAKSFTDNDIMLHFYILDILACAPEKSVKEITDAVSVYLSAFDEYQIDESTIRKKLKEYEKLGIIKSKKNGRELVFSRNENCVNLASWKEAVSFFSEEDPIGVIGSYILDKYEKQPDYFSFKHHYILHALESEILYTLFEAIGEHRIVRLEIQLNHHNKNAVYHEVLPLKIYISAQGGRRYLMAYHYGIRRPAFYRLDNIKSVSFLKTELYYQRYYDIAEKFKNRLWGVSAGRSYKLQHIEMTLFVGDDEQYIVNRLNREKRYGSITQADKNHYKFSADVYDAEEMMPWIRSFIGRITSLECSDKTVRERFYSDVEQMKKMYGGDGDAV